jgi:hypothetical protein
MQVQITINADTATGSVTINGPIDNMMLMYWLLGEAKRMVEARAAKREAASGDGGIVVVKGNLKV